MRQDRRIEHQARRQARQGSVGALPECHARSLHQGEHSDFFMNTFEEPRGIAAPHATSYEVIMLHPT
jgi:hypothetical protein